MDTEGTDLAETLPPRWRVGLLRTATSEEIHRSMRAITEPSSHLPDGGDICLK